ncbi:MAG: glycoside hydrolase family 2, partial [Muribaculum sp.]|nr:glycoside hydrolase family 2 [Muribaculum sp.]
AYPAFASEGFSETFTLERKDNNPWEADLKPKELVPMRSLSVKVHAPWNAVGCLKALLNGEWTIVKYFNIDRYNEMDQVGWDVYAPVTVTLPGIEAEQYKLAIEEAGGGHFDVTLSERPAIERYSEKTLAKMFQQPLPLWGQYMWPVQAEASVDTWTIDPSKVVVLTENVAEDGTLTWEAPEGQWVVSRLAMVPTGVTNSPAVPEATGLETDKMSREHIRAHFDNFMGEILRRIPAEDRKSFKIVVEDSYETGGQNWTDGLEKKFEERYGYSPLPYLPTLQGIPVGNQDLSDRFLWDLRRLVADMIADEYVAGLAEVSHENGLTTWLENYGHWGFPGEFLMYGSRSDEIGGEFWSEGTLGDIENRAASSCAHIYGKPRVWAESCTSGGPVFSRYPAIMKQRVDRFFTEGINSTLLHLYIHQDETDVEPGLAAWFGNEFNRKNIWFEQMDVFSNYLKRCNYVLQQGIYVADVAYFIGEDAPKMTGVCDPALPAGYSFDYINGEILRDHARVVNGHLVLDAGMEYSLLVLPKQETIRPELLEKIKTLVENGLTVLGPQPERSPSLQDYPAADNKVKALAAEMWAPVGEDGKSVKEVGKGRVYSGYSIEEIFAEQGIIPDLVVAEGQQMPLFIHRSLKDAQIYFVSNPTEQKVNLDLTLRAGSKDTYPQLWDPITGEVRNLPAYTVNDNGSVTIPVTFYPIQSFFIVLRKGESPAKSLTENFPAPEVAYDFVEPWNVDFDAARRGPKETVSMDSLYSWSDSDNDSIKYYAGKAVYTTTIDIPEINAGLQYYLDFDCIMVMGRVFVNDQEVGGVWTLPYAINITPYLKAGNNDIKVEVVNNWKNRLIGDQALPEDERPTKTNVHNYSPDLQQSGIIGGVQIRAYNYSVE